MAQYRIATIVWGVSVVFVVMTNAVGTFLAFGQEYDPMLFFALLMNGIGCVVAGLSFALPRGLRAAHMARVAKGAGASPTLRDDQAGPDADPVAPVTSVSQTPGSLLLIWAVVRIALAESAGLIAFATTIIAGPLPGGAVALAASLLALAAAYPKLGEWQRFESDLAAAYAGSVPIVSG